MTAESWSWSRCAWRVSLICVRVDASIWKISLSALSASVGEKKGEKEDVTIFGRESDKKSDAWYWNLEWGVFSLEGTVKQSTSPTRPIVRNSSSKTQKLPQSEGIRKMISIRTLE